MVEEIGRKLLGNLGEDLAARYLEDKGYQIIERNYYCRQGEIDLIVSRGIGQESKIAGSESEIVFIEVKTISNLAFGAAEYRIDRRKQAKIRYTAREYLSSQDKYYEDVRFDGIFIFRKENGWKINHIENAF